MRGAPWGFTYGLTACEAAATIWQAGSTEHIEVVEKSVLKILDPDFRYPSRDARLSMARLCAIQGRYEEATQWFGKACHVLDEQGWRPLRAIADYDHALMYLRRRAPGDDSRAEPLLVASLAQFRELGMTGWVRRAEQSAFGDGPAQDGESPAQ
jgi:hypothetical protein